MAYLKCSSEVYYPELHWMWSVAEVFEAASVFLLKTITIHVCTCACVWRKEDMGWLVVGWGECRKCTRLHDSCGMKHLVSRSQWHITQLAQPLTGERISQLEQRRLPAMIIVSLTII